MSKKGYKQTEEHKRKISKALMGKIVSEESKAKMRNKVVTEETKRKMSEAHKGHKHSEETKVKLSQIVKGINHPMYGKCHSEETIAKMKEVKKGSNNSNWKGGISFEPYSPEFNENLRDMVRERDGYICQLCGKSQRENGRRLSVHHVDYNKENCNLNNLITLCISCNNSANFNREYWTDYFNNIWGDKK